MEKISIVKYIAPEVEVMTVMSDSVLCVSGDHEGIYFEDWEDED